MKLTLFIEKKEKTVYFDESIVVGGLGPWGEGGEAQRGPRPQIMLKKATVFWNYNNIVEGFNDSASFDDGSTSASEGYLDFDALETFVKALAKAGGGVAEFGKNVDDGTSRIKTSGDLKLGKMGLLLGFNEGDVIAGDSRWTISPNQVDINRGLRYVEILCDAVESGGSLNGKRSNLIGTLPITSEQSLKGSVQHYTDIESKVEIQKGVYNRMTFRVRGNNGSEDIGAVLLELYIG